MKKTMLIVSVLLWSTFTYAQSNLDDALKRKMVMKNLSSMPLAFTENKGQFGDKTLFKVNAGGATFYFCKDEVAYMFTRVSDELVEDDVITQPELPGIQDDMNKPLYKKESMLIKAQFVGANPNPEIIGADRLSHNNNYFYGNNPDMWRTDVPNYSSIIYKNIYPGIDLKYYGNGSSMKYDFIIQPGADMSQIAIRYEGVVGLTISPLGYLAIQTRFGDINEGVPFIYQEIDGVENQIIGSFRIIQPGVFGFEIETYFDPDYPLIIDPELIYSTYLGGSSGGYEKGRAIAIDNLGNAYITGETPSSNFPIVNPYDASYNGSNDVFMTKLSVSGNSILYSTYFGGSGHDYGHDIAVDGSGNAYVTGFTQSSDYPIINPFDNSLDGGRDAFVTKLSVGGNSLVYSTYLGGSAHDFGHSIAVNSSGNAYVTGRTESSNFPMVNSYDGSYNGLNDVFVTKLSVGGNSIVYSTYLGGSNNDYGLGIAVDDYSSAYITGSTLSSDFPTVNPYDSTFNGAADVVVAKLSPIGNTLIYSTYVGGQNEDFGNGITVHGSGNAYITGSTGSLDFPMVNPYDGSHNGLHDAFVTKISISGDSLNYSTYVGGSNNEQVVDIDVDASGNAYIVGKTQSSDFPTVNPYDSILNGVTDAVVTKISPEGNSLVYSTFLGGSGDESGWGIDVDALGYAYITGYTYSSNYPLANPYDGSLSGGRDAFVAKIGSSTGNITGIVTQDNTSPLVGIIVDLTDSTGNLYASTLTDSLGYYQFPDVPNGDYTVSIVTPLGYIADHESQDITVAGADIIADFNLTLLDIIPEQRSRGYWKHEVSHIIEEIEEGEDEETDYTAAEMMGFIEQITIHFAQNPINQIAIYDGSAATTQLDSLKVLKKILRGKRQDGDSDEDKKLRKGKAELMALLLNVVSGKISQAEVISEDGANVSQAITYSWLVLTNQITCTPEEEDDDEDEDEDDCHCNHKKAEKILKKINHAKTVKAGVIPLDIQFIAYKTATDLPRIFSLSQSYPNPFNAQTVFEYALPEAAIVTIEVFDLMGRKIKTLVNQQQEAGYHQITWDAKDQASGMYFYKIQAGEFTETKKMTLLK